MINMTRNEFNKLREEGEIFPLVKTYSGDQTTPINIFYNLDGEYKFLLESAGAGEKQGRFSFLGENPISIIKSQEDQITQTTNMEEIKKSGKILDFIQDYMKVGYKKDLTDLPFTGGLVGYIGYDTIGQIEEIEMKNPKEINLPDAFLLNYKLIIAYDHLKKNIYIIYNSYPQERKEYTELLTEIDLLYEKIRAINVIKNIREESKDKKVESNFTQEEFESAVEKAKDYIDKGEVSQVVISQRFTLQTESEAFDVYRRLRSLNPSPYLFYIDYGDFQIVGASPESLVSLNENKVITNPIAGTRRRGRDKEEDKRLREELLSDPKEKKEHDMLVELGKKDLETISKEGSVKVDKYMHLENYSHVMHLVATVSGEINEGVGAMEAFKSCFPAGTVSGFPRKKAMEIIEELENVKREIYSGAVGYFSLNGQMDFCIGIRTIIFKDKLAHVQAGAGIVKESIATNEYKETKNKARAFIEVI